MKYDLYKIDYCLIDRIKIKQRTCVDVIETSMFLSFLQIDRSSRYNINSIKAVAIVFECSISPV